MLDRKEIFHVFIECNVMVLHIFSFLLIYDFLISLSDWLYNAYVNS